MVFQLYDLDVIAVIAAMESKKHCKNSWGIAAEQQGRLSCSFVPTNTNQYLRSQVQFFLVIVFFGEEKIGYPSGCRAAEAELSECQAQMRAGEMAMSWENNQISMFQELVSTNCWVFGTIRLIRLAKKVV